MNYFIHKTLYFKQILLLSVLLFLVGNLKAQCDYSDDFITLPAPTQTSWALTYMTADITTNAGWNCKNIQILKGPDAGVNPSTVRTKYKAMNTGEQGVSLDGFAGSLGSITSPVLSNGCDSILFNYTSRSTGEQRILEFSIEKEGLVVWKDTFDQVVATSNTKYQYGIGKIGITGACTLKITNITNHPITSGQGAYGYDVVLWNICMQAPVTEVSTPIFTIKGREKLNKVYWESAKVGIATTTRDTRIYYTLDGTDPNSTSTLYTDSIPLTSTTKVRAIAVYDTLKSAIVDTLITIAGPQKAALPFNESFASGLGDWYTYNTAGVQEWTTSSEGEMTFSQMSGAPDEYTVVANEDWLISPAFTPEEGKSIVFGFNSAKQNEGNPIAVKYSTDYTGVGDPSTATWIDITDKATLPTTEQTWTSSGDITINETQPIRFAFVYTSTTDEASLWKVKDIYTHSAQPIYFTPKPYTYTGVGNSYNSTLNVALSTIFDYSSEVSESTPFLSPDTILFESDDPTLITLNKYAYNSYSKALLATFNQLANHSGKANVKVTVLYKNVESVNTITFNILPLIAANDSYDVLPTVTTNLLVSNNDAFLNSKTGLKLEILQAPLHGTASIVSGAIDTLKYTPLVNTPNYTIDSLKYQITDVNGNSSSATVYVNIHANSYASQVFDFLPAPGQFTNETIGKSTSASKILNNNSGMISLGGFGGYVVLGFDQPIVNNPKNPYGVDFSVKGNSFTASLYGVWSEPAAVQVMKDLNGNGIPDDGDWYELAGSDYYLSTTKKNVEMTYYNPSYSVRYTVPWKTNMGENGALLSNAFHKHSYYPSTFDFGCNRDSLTYSGNVIKSSLDMSSPGYVNFYRAPAFGYSDNRGYNKTNLCDPLNPYYKDEKGAAGDGFDLSWAVDRNGNHVDLDSINFVRIYTAGNANAGWLGEWSSEVLGVGITTPDPNYVPKDYYLNYIGITQLKVLKGQTCQYQGLLFKNGRPTDEGTPVWSTSDPSVGTVDNTGKFTAVDNGITWLYFSQKSDIIRDSIQVKVVELQSVNLEMEGNSALSSDTTSLYKGESIYITAQGVDNYTGKLNNVVASRYTYEKYNWVSTDPEIGTIDNGLFKGLKVGQTKLYAVSMSNPLLKDSIVVVVNDVPSITILNNPVIISKEKPLSGSITCESLFTTGNNSIIYINSVTSKNGKVVASVDKNVVSYNFTESIDTLQFNVTSYWRMYDIEVGFKHESFATDLNQVVSKSDVSVYPTLFTDHLYIKLNQSDRISIYNIFGQKMLDMQGTTGENSIETSSFAAGTYILKSGKETIKLIKAAN